MKYFAAITFFLLSSVSLAGDILVGQYTYHFDEKTRNSDKYLDTHPLIGYSAKNYTIFAMKNTYNETSIAALYTKKYDATENVTLSASVGAASGYEKHKTSCKFDEVICVAYLSADIHPSSNRFGIVFTFAPSVFIGAGLKVGF